MGKRAADEYIYQTSSGQVVSEPEKLVVGLGTATGAVQSATAAQMAARKVAAPKRRLAGTTTSFAGSPMAKTAPPQANGFQVPQASSFTWGQPTPVATQASHSFPPQSNSFTFGQPAANTEQQSTSFPQANGFQVSKRPGLFGVSQPAINTEQHSNGFQASKQLGSFGISQPTNNTEQHSNGFQPSKQPGLFGMSQPVINPAQQSNSFAQVNGFQASQQPGSFGTSQPATNTQPQSNFFSQANGFQASQQSGLFGLGQPAMNTQPNQNSLFPQANERQVPQQSNSFTFGQTATNTAQGSTSLFAQVNGFQAPAPATSFNFGQPATNHEQPSNSAFQQANGFQAPPSSSFNFGQPALQTAVQQANGEPAPQSHSFAFGQTATATAAAPEQRAHSAFSQSGGFHGNGFPASQPNSFPFGQSVTNAASTSSGLFGQAPRPQVPPNSSDFAFHPPIAHQPQSLEARRPLPDGLEPVEPVSPAESLAFEETLSLFNTAFRQGALLQDVPQSSPLAMSWSAPHSQIPQAPFTFPTSAGFQDATPMKDAEMTPPPEYEADLPMQTPESQAPAASTSVAPVVAEFPQPVPEIPMTPAADAGEWVRTPEPTTANTPAVETAPETRQQTFATRRETPAPRPETPAQAPELENSDTSRAAITLPTATSTLEAVTTSAWFTTLAPPMADTLAVLESVPVESALVTEESTTTPNPPAPPSALLTIAPPTSTQCTADVRPVSTSTSAFQALAKTDTTNPDARIRLLTQGPLDIPDDMSAQDFLPYSKNSRLHALGRELQHRIVHVDPFSQDFDNLLLHYFATREKLGFGVKVHLVTSTKRKADSTDVPEDGPSHAKRARIEFASESEAPAVTPSPPAPSVATGTANVVHASMSPSGADVEQNSNVETPKPASANIFEAASSRTTEQPKFNFAASTSQSAGNPFQSTRAFSSGRKNIFESASAAAPEKPPAALMPSSAPPKSNPFQSIVSSAPDPPSLFRSTSAGTSEQLKFNFTPATPQPATNIFQSVRPAQSESTTPAKSPEKAAFKVPQFGSGASVDFMASFAKQSEASMATLAAETKSKRKLEEFDSDEDDEAEWERKYEEEARAKRNKLVDIAKSAPSLPFNQTALPTTEKPSGELEDGPATSSNATDYTAVEKKAVDRDDTGPPSPNSLFDPTPEPDRTDDDEGLPEDEEYEEGGAVDVYESSEDGDYEDEDGDAEEDDEEELSEEGGDEESDEADADADADANTGEEPREDNRPEQASENKEVGQEDDSEDSEDGDDHDRSVATAKSTTTTDSKSLEERITFPDVPTVTPKGLGNSMLKKKTAPNNSFKPFTPLSADIKPTPEAPTFSPITPFTGFAAPKFNQPRATFNFTPTPVTKEEPVLGKTSVLNGGFINSNGPIPGEGLFGSRPSTPQPDSKAAGDAVPTAGKINSIFGAKTDQTWKTGSPIKFGTPAAAATFGAPAFNFTAATPPAKENSASKPFTSLFGGDSPSLTKPPVPANASVGFSFGEPSKPAPGYLGVASHLLPPGPGSSAGSSRATSPGLTDTESVATNESEDATNDPQTSLLATRPGEENEEVLFEVRSKALKYFDQAAAKESNMQPDTYNSIGLGVLRVLKNHDSGTTRMLFRTEPGANILVNANLIPTMNYLAGGTTTSGQVRCGIANPDGSMDKFFFKVKTAEIAEELARVLNENK